MKEKALQLAIIFVGREVSYVSLLGKTTDKIPAVEEVASLVVRVAKIFEAYLEEVE